ncbi:hypothetical protein Dvina_22375 [Dactylosporangium vinaceum]|uniref:Uncharacterized protein n=1 Tax=Dactylosporangium vinaceum TaxID=53362 RepID=A0ABV5MR95_9ACTN|nr:hypothetical protein [Dactylosporangium vinaceum]UAC00556.1 hypothetical protein Dvina_22375 [Dactylosporangium vinaceum]
MGTGAALLKALAHGTAGLLAADPGRSSPAHPDRVRALAQRVPVRAGRVRAGGDELYYEVRGGAHPRVHRPHRAGDARP